MLPKSHPIHHERCRRPFPYEIFRPQGNGPFPVLFITPLLGRVVLLEDLFFERIFARFFARHGIAAVLIDRPIFRYNPEMGLEQIHRYIEVSLERNRAILEKVQAESWADPEKIGTYGMSFGSIINMLWASTEKRFKAHVFAMGGGNLPEIFMKSTDPLMVSYRDAALRHCGLDPERLKEKLKVIFWFDPLHAAPHISRENILMILGKWDRVVPTCHGVELKEALGHPETIFLPMGHYLALLTFPVLQWRVLNFYKKKFFLEKKEALTPSRL